MRKILILALTLMVPTYAVAESAFNDAEIAHILLTANKVDIENGALAKKHTSDTSVYAFAARMVKEHTEILKQEKDLITKLSLMAQDNFISKDLETNGEQNLSKLKYFSENKFEKNYIEAEIRLHQKLIKIVDDRLLPNVKNEELKAMIVNVRHILVSHLEHAEIIQTSHNKEKH
jgi:putative membrane protein